MQSNYVNGIKKYIIHIPECDVKRQRIVNDLIALTGAEVFDAIRANDGALGCYLSHLEIYKKNPNESVIIFEDDCVINDKNMLSLLDELKGFDLIYFGVNRIINNNVISKRNLIIPEGGHIGSFGTHSMWVSAKARQIFLEYAKDKPFYLPVDTLWNFIAYKNKLNVWRPDISNIYKYCEQGLGIISTIEKKVRSENYKHKGSWNKENKCHSNTCNYKVNPDIKNNGGDYCCLGCKRSQSHGINCLREIYTKR